MKEKRQTFTLESLRKASSNREAAVRSCLTKGEHSWATKDGEEGAVCTKCGTRKPMARGTPKELRHFGT